MIPLLPAKRSWAAAIGNFIINFGGLDYLIFDFLEVRLPPKQFAALKDKHFQDRVKRIERYVEQKNCPAETRARSAQFFARLAPLRELRNHIAHGYLLMRLDDAGQNFVLTLTLPKHLSDAFSPNSKHLSFEGLQQALTELKELIEEFRQLSEILTPAVQSP